ncbi:hypothetical protein [Psychrosphaera aestuarii]|uniref:hypothetical protein n=1 Tax=Psychrosphaera aestuarii TaxID=1266052 RepID=UPI001B33E8BC|nr:hypothetical protein [Psychrosphaera aestuarii]
MKYIFLSLMFMALLSPWVLAEQKPLKLETGLWEGISDSVGLDYHLLQINEGGEHAFFTANFSSAFRDGKRIPFTNNDIVCTQSECTVTVTSPKNNKRALRFIIVPALGNTDSLHVLETAFSYEKPVLSQSYQLEKKNGPSTVREFINLYSNTLKLMQSERPDYDGINGFWIGVADYHNKKQLIALNVQPGESSEFVYFANGSDVVIKSTFNSDDIILNSDKDNPFITIKTSHPTFANQIVLHQQNKNMISGHWYSYHKGQALETASFQLYRVER